jgi:hypothetical protein
MYWIQTALKAKIKNDWSLTKNGVVCTHVHNKSFFVNDQSFLILAFNAVCIQYIVINVLKLAKVNINQI